MSEKAKSIKAQTLVQQLTETNEPVYKLEQGTRIQGKVDLRYRTVRAAVDIQNCRFEGEVDLRDCEFQQSVNFSGCTFHNKFYSGYKDESHTGLAPLR